MSIFVGTPSRFIVAYWIAMETMIFLYYHNAFIFDDNIFLHLSGPIEQINIQKKMS